MEIVKYILTGILVAPVLISAIFGLGICILIGLVILLRNERFNNIIISFLEFKERLEEWVSEIKEKLTDLENIKLAVAKCGKQILVWMIFFVISYIVVLLWVNSINLIVDLIVSIIIATIVTFSFFDVISL